MARSNRARNFARPPGRTNVWFAFRLANTNFTGATALLASLNAAALLLRPFTIIRTRMVISVKSDQIATAEFFSGALGVQVVTESASTAGVASVPTPITEADADFLVYQGLMSDYEESGTPATAWDSIGQGNYWTVDSKAMRKVGSDDDVVVTLEQGTSVGVNIAFEGRMLVKLH